MTKLIPVVEKGKISDYIYYCPACGYYHNVYVDPDNNKNGACWLFNGDMQAPTFTPSVMHRVKVSDGRHRICHHYIREGRIIYLADSTHKMAGETVEMNEV